MTPISVSGDEALLAMRRTPGLPTLAALRLGIRAALDCSSLINLYVVLLFSKMFQPLLLQLYLILLNLLIPMQVLPDLTLQV